jgi:hypothetical protein
MGERDMMICRSCGQEERASEGYPCENCGTFICQICTLRGVTLCKPCEALEVEEDADDEGSSADSAPSA